MDITKLPLTTTAVDADLRRRADFRGVDRTGEVYYMLGMCEALLAEANAEIVRLHAKLAVPPAEVMAAHIVELGR
jgi:hypothetical protein